MRYITFPPEEHPDLFERLGSGLNIFTTRVDAEAGAWRTGEVVDSPFGLLEIVDVNTFEDLSDHPFLGELTDDQIVFLSTYDRFDLIELVRGNTARRVAASWLGRI